MKITKDHDEIRNWAQKNGGKPQLITDPEATGDEVGIRIDFPGSRDDYYQPNQGRDQQDTSWERFFEEFERRELQMEYDEVIHFTDPSLSYRFLRRKPVKEAPPIKPEDVF